jgi:hypothetical protein
MRVSVAQSPCTHRSTTRRSFDRTIGDSRGLSLHTFTLLFIYCPLMRHNDAIQNRDFWAYEGESTRLTSRVMWHDGAGQSMRNLLSKEALSTV